MLENTRESAKNHIFESPATFLTRVNGIVELGNGNSSTISEELLKDKVLRKTMFEVQ